MVCVSTSAAPRNVVLLISDNQNRDDCGADHRSRDNCMPLNARKRQSTDTPSEKASDAFGGATAEPDWEYIAGSNHTSKSFWGNDAPSEHIVNPTLWTI